VWHQCVKAGGLSVAVPVKCIQLCEGNDVSDWCCVCVCACARACVFACVCLQSSTFNVHCPKCTLLHE